MGRPIWTAALILSIASGIFADVGGPPDVQQLREEVAELQRTIAELKRQNATLRTQWGQATMEIDRLRGKIAAMRKGGEAPEPAAGPAKPQAAAEGSAPEVARLQGEIEDLRSRNEELTALAGLGPRDERVASQDARIKATFVEDTGRTVVRTEQDKLRMTAGSNADHFLSLAYSYEGKAMVTPSGAPEEVTMFIQAVYSGGIHSQDQPLVLTIDGEPVTVPVAEYDANRRSTNLAGRRRVSKDDETVTFLLDRELLRKLARAVSVSGRMGKASFELTRDQIALFTAVKKRIEAGM